MDAPLPEGLVDAWISYLGNDNQRPRGESLYHEVFDHPILFPLQRKAETSKMIRLAQSLRPKVIYEIGSDKGGSVYHWVKGVPTIKRMISCEIRGVPYMHAFNGAFGDVDFLWMAESSYADTTIDRVKTWLGDDKIDILFIDGDKGAFLKDFWAYHPMMATDGVVMMHDVVDEPMKSAFNSVSELYSNIHIRDISEVSEIIERENASIPPASSYEGWLRYWKERSCSVGVVFLGEKKRV